MKKYFALIAVVVFSIYLFGCGKKQSAMDETIEPVTMEAITVAPLGADTSSVQQPTAVPQEVNFNKPTASDIQTALKNAGFYSGAIDGKVGPRTKKAIEEFQKASGLTADGKVGSRTWAVLSKYLSGPITVPAKKR